MKTSVYLLNNALKNIGRGVRYPQHQKMTAGYDFSASNSIHKLRSNILPDFEPNFNSIFLSKGVSLTDKISSAPIPWHVLLVSKKLLDILTSLKLPPYKIYKPSIIHDTVHVNNYYALHLIDPREHYEFIDYKSSKFWISEIITKKNIEQVYPESYSDIEEIEAKIKHNNKDVGLNEESVHLWAEELKMVDDFYDTYDVFSLAHFAYPLTFKVTERVKNLIETQGITGVTFTRISENREEIEDFFDSKKIFTIFV